MLKVIRALPLLAFVVAASAMAEDPPEASQVTTAKSRNSNDRIICRTEDELGSRLRKRRVCLKQSEWRAMQADTSRMMERKTSTLPMQGT